MSMFFTYCCVSVEAPCVAWPATLFASARDMPRMSMPPCSQNRSSSIAMTAFCIGSETLSSGTTIRFCA
ncbi:hypothetical protein ISCU110981_15480 [Isoptericola cucumis]